MTLYNDSQSLGKLISGQLIGSKAGVNLRASGALEFYEVQPFRLFADCPDVRGSGRLRCDEHIAVPSHRPAQVHPDEAYALRVWQGSGRLSPGKILGEVLPHRDDFHPVRH